ncbi:hypothetical protein TWF694_010013 [Orbilia ellipsospora]|uniref:Uncharacterized protein n=1 Tax=Orbilia ellipsospora TaxID=2528407 RepID=A0AAV9XEZ6_9PEZI
MSSSQINDTDPSPYDQAFFVTQGTINEAFANMWALADDDSPMVHFSYELRDGQNIDGELNTPSISLNYFAQDVTRVEYHLKFRSGTMNLFISDNFKDKTMKPYDLTGWDIVLPVSTKREIYKKGDKEYDTLADKVGFPNGTFSITKLFLVASSSAIIDHDKSTFGTIDWKNEPHAARTNFNVFIETWLSDESEAGKNILGYSINGTDPEAVNGFAPSFVPTSIDDYTYPWIEPGASSSTGEDGLDLNSLSYLTMSDFNQPPDVPGLRYTGEFVTKNDGAVLCINSSIFWDKWLLPLLQELNMCTQVNPDKPYLSWCEDDRYTALIAIKYHIGNSNPGITSSDPYFAFKPKTDSANQVYWSWESNIPPATNESVNPVGTWTITASETSTSTSTVRFDMGGQKISITGTNQFVYFFSEKNLGGGLGHGGFTATTQWHLNFALGAVNDGGLQITRILDRDGEKPCTTTYTDEIHGFQHEDQYDQYCKDIDAQILEYFEYNLDNIARSLIYALQHQHEFVLPGNGAFLMGDAKFNRRGDLLVNLHYNGTPPPPTPKNSRATMQNAYVGYYKNPRKDAPKTLEWLPERWSKLPARQIVEPRPPRKIKGAGTIEHKITKLTD